MNLYAERRITKQLEKKKRISFGVYFFFSFNMNGFMGLENQKSSIDKKFPLFSTIEFNKRIEKSLMIFKMEKLFRIKI